jgi:enoyl-CoA hydratase
MVRYELLGHVAVLTLARPSARNAVDAEVARTMEASLDAFEAAEDAWVGVVAAAGPVFCAGADLRAVSAGEGASLITARGGFAGIVQREVKKPLVAAVDGPALAGGCEIALACDLVVASRAATFGLPEVKRSLVAAAGALFRLPRAIPRAVALEMIMTGDPIDAARAHALGLVNAVVEPGEARAAAIALAERIAKNAPLAVRESRAVARRAVAADEAALWQASFDAFMAVAASEDFQEGPRAFLEKRAPRWRGR